MDVRLAWITENQKTFHALRKRPEELWNIAERKRYYENDVAAMSTVMSIQRNTTINCTGYSKYDATKHCKTG